MSVPVIAVDGPSGSGKGTLAHWLAHKLSWHLLDSGALYRAVAVMANKALVATNDHEKLTGLAQNLDIQFKPLDSGEVAVFLEGEDVSRVLRNENTAAVASQVAAIQPVRDALFERQKQFEKAPGLVADGRDMGTVVFPHAPLKIYLTASAEKRAQRRHKQLKGKGFDANLAALQRDIEARDERDTNRSVSPLKPAEDAIIIDTSDMRIKDVCEKVYQLALETYNLES